MSTLPTRLAAVGASLACAVALAVTGAGSADAAKRPTSTDVSNATATVSAAAKAAGAAKYGAAVSDALALEAFWTPARMRAAKPADQDGDLKAKATAYEAKARADQKAGKKPVTHDGPVRAANGSTSKLFGPASAGKGELAAYNPNVPYYDPTAYTQGKLFFSKNGQDGWQCSATIVNSEGKDTIWTAGHCLHGGQGSSWHYNVAFVPAYDDDLANPRPYGTWTANQLWSKSAWVSNTDFSQDMGVAIMNTNWGWHIVDYFGGQGITVNRGKSGVWENAFGYPAEWPFDGGNLMQCWGSTSPEWDAWFVWSQTVKIPCDMTRGSSGGGWFYGYNGDWGWLNGVNSRIDRIVGPTIMLSPYFDDDAWGLYNTTRNL
ncbi:MAG: hypothetical protein IPL45_13400 [Actinomycetales bacterium]|nr:hypothetical protein [Actinomycetales bacterium]